MKSAVDPVGKKNDKWLLKLGEEADLVVAVWGNHGRYLNRDKQVAGLFPQLQCLRVTGVGQPHHTRGLPNGIQPLPYCY